MRLFVFDQAQLNLTLSQVFSKTYLIFRFSIEQIFLIALGSSSTYSNFAVFLLFHQKLIWKSTELHSRGNAASLSSMPVKIKLAILP